MKRRDFFIICILGILFFLILSKRKTLTGQRNPPANSEKKGTFKSYYEDSTPEEFITDPNLFTSESKLKKDIDYKRDKMLMDMNMELQEFMKTHDWQGKDREKYNKLKEIQNDRFHDVKLKNQDLLRKFQEEMNVNDTGLH